ncbi:type II toxin-antitoxin system Phd/YefM family antitoxin [Desulfonatronum thiodismutans]|uniref:type II toxin-antitoxin system Phd/YefM family antitoxin n=1 Tax=Desulfonatronum thiodismutans TaxID=159290 RepID=UPI0004ABD7B7|nr:type II toxin-antitoxin system prevent-host-death family antitoxin [Desulfonatronum thiodismutans]
MEAISYTRFRGEIAKIIDRVVEDHEAIIVTRNTEPGVVILSLEDYEALQETAYLTRSPANARRLVDALDQLRHGNKSVHSLDDIAELAHDH